MGFFQINIIVILASGFTLINGFCYLISGSEKNIIGLLAAL